jgi:predicted Ser/Thr protein kinase
MGKSQSGDLFSSSTNLPVSPQVSLGTDPTRVGPYRIERKLGAGGMGTVYLARHEQTEKIVALKILAPSLAREAGLVARFMREIDSLQKLKNPNVVELYDHGVDGDMYYYAMEYIDGETLTARLRREKRLPWRDVIELSIQICIALKAAHDAGIIHRDLKPSNLLLAPDGKIKLTDFGVAQVFAGSKLTVTGGIIGTAEYMSPEQGDGKRLTKRSDLYSLGAVMYVMLTGRPPFSGKTTLDVVHKHKYSQFDRPQLIVPEIPYWLDEIICQLLEKDPDKRFADAYVVNRKLQEVVRKVEISKADGTLFEGSAVGDETTMEAGSARAPGRAASTGPGPGTMMRDLFRAQFEVEKGPSGLRKVLENTWVLVGLLVALVAGVGLWTTAGRITPEKRFEKGVALLEKDEDANWETVRDDYFAPLVELNSDEWNKKLKPYLERIRLHEPRGRSKAFGKRGLVASRVPATEIERVLVIAKRQQEEGDFTAADRSLKALAVLLEDNPKYQAQRRLVEESLRQLANRRDESPPDWSFIDKALERAGELAAKGKRAEAVRIWQSVIDLYGNDPRAKADVERARRMLTDPETKKRPGQDNGSQ